MYTFLEFWNKKILDISIEHLRNSTMYTPDYQNSSGSKSGVDFNAISKSRAKKSQKLTYNIIMISFKPVNVQ